MAYVPTITSKTINRDAQLLTLDVEFRDGAKVFTKKLNFALSDSIEDIRRKLKGYTSQLEAGETNADTIPTGEVDISTVDLSKPQEDIEYEQWVTAFRRLETVQKLIDLGVVANDNPKVVQLRNSVQTGLKASYIDKL